MTAMVATPGIGRRTSGPNQEIRFARSRDGTRIAHARHGSGPPLVVVACWLSHLQHDWQSPVWRHFLEDLGAFTTLVRYDLRGHGLSDRDVDDFSLDAMVDDLEAVIADEGLDRFAMMGMSGNSPVAIAYALRHPERVTRLALYGGYAGWRVDDSPESIDEEAAFVAMVRAGWARPDPRFRRWFTQMFIPDATEEQMRWFDDLQRTSTTTRNVLAAREGRRGVDLSDELPNLEVPTLVLHALDDATIDFRSGSGCANLITDARLVPLASRNHILLADEPAWPVFLDELRSFMAPDMAQADASMSAAPGLGDLSPRETEIIRLAASGLDNADIAASLGLSTRTVERHLSNAYLKLGITGRSARSAAVAALLRSELG
jgi:pimeloyl-ACP methyl ester carboxylesterase/DNA-binding CsgD family transcriptional regulator